MPVSTTQVISSAIMGVGASQGARRVRWGVARRILVAWILTLPAAGHPCRAGLGRAERARPAMTSTADHPATTTHRPGGIAMSFRILPKDPRFFELFAADGDNLAAAAAALHVMVDSTTTSMPTWRASRRSRSVATRSTRK